MKIEDERLSESVPCLSCASPVPYRAGSKSIRCQPCALIRRKERRKERYWEHVEANREAARRWNAENPDKKKAASRQYYVSFWSKQRLAKEYGITLEQWSEMAESQGWACAICDGPPTGKGAQAVLNVDHDHVTGKVRQLLCSDCNRLLGCAKEDIGILQSAILYLEKHGN